MSTPFSDHLLFFRQFREQFETTGAIAPSSRFLANAITEPFRHRSIPARLLEVGPGTGAFTRTIVRHLNLDERFDLVELNTEFAQRLERRFAEERHFRAVGQQSRVHACAVQDFEADTPYDFIISGLPLNNFSADLVRQLFDSWFGLLAPGGVLSYFEYMYVRPIRRLVARGDEKTRLSSLDEIIGARIERHRFRRDWVFVNCPPAWVQHLRKEG